MAVKPTHRTLAPRTAVDTQPRALGIWIPIALIGLLALLPRCLGLADFMTIDEPYHWIGRVRRFSEALAAGNWAATNQTGHPGVTTMWLGSLGRWLAATQGLYDGGRAGNSAAFLALLRLPLAVVNGLAVVIGYLLLRRLVRPHTALVAALLWALSPFLIAHSRLLHLDALLTSFMTISVLALLQIDDGRWTMDDGRWTVDRGLWTVDDKRQSSVLGSRFSVLGSRFSVLASRFSLAPLLLGGASAGLALLTKSPSLVLLPVGGLLLLLVSPPGPWMRRIGWAVGRYVIWLAVALAVVWVGWPAMWVAPREAIMTVVNEVIINGGQPHHSGNFFWGRAVGDPGWLFYPAVVLWRSSPVTLLGLLLLPLALRRRADDEPVRDRERRTLAGLLLFAALFSLALSIEPKKFDRYLLPVFPALDVLAAAGLVWLVRPQTTDRRPQTTDTGRETASRLSPLASRLSPLAALVLILSLQLLFYHPYYLAYFNPLVGGGGVAQEVMLVGWGEGMEQVGAWLKERPDLSSGPVLSVIGPTLSPFVPGQVLDLQEKFLGTHPSYAVLYARSQQRDESATAQEYVRQLPPLWTLRMYGIEYARVYQLPRPFSQPIDAVFGAGLHLRGFSQEQQGATLVITPSWDVQQDQQGGRFAFVHVVGPDGTRVAQADVPIDGGMFPQWQAGQQFGGPIPLALPANLPPGAYRIIIGVYDPASGARLPLTVGTALPADVAGPEALLLQIVQR